MEKRTQENLYEAFVGEAKAYHRLHAFARKAEDEDLTQIARLFRAVAAAEGVHAARHLSLLGETVVKSTEENLISAFQTESTVNTVYYPEFIQKAEEEGNKEAAQIFSQARDVEEGHASLYKEAMGAFLNNDNYDYHVCMVCGFVAKKEAPDECPICLVKRAMFRRVA